MLELGSSGSVRGVSSNGHPYRDPRPTADLRPDPEDRSEEAGKRSFDWAAQLSLIEANPARRSGELYGALFPLAPRFQRVQRELGDPLVIKPLARRHCGSNQILTQ